MYVTKLNIGPCGFGLIWQIDVNNAWITFTCKIKVTQSSERFGFGNHTCVTN